MGAGFKFIVGWTRFSTRYFLVDNFLLTSTSSLLHQQEGGMLTTKGNRRTFKWYKKQKKFLTISKQINKAMTNNIYIFIDIKKERKMCNDSSIIFTQMFTSLLGPRIFSFLFLLSFPAPTSMMSAASPSSWRGKEKATQSASSIQPRLDQDQGTVNANPSKHTC